MLEQRARQCRRTAGREALFREARLIGAANITEEVCSQMHHTIAKRIAWVAAAAGFALAQPASAQFSDGYRFLEAVKKRDGEAATSALSQPGSTIVNARDISSGETGLHITVARRDLTWTSFLIQKGANPDIDDRRGLTPLELAVSLRFIEGVEALIDARADVNVTNATGETPLITATHLRDNDLAKLLLAAGADPDRSDSSGRSARDYASAGRANPVLAAIEAAEGEGGRRAAYGPAL